MTLDEIVYRLRRRLLEDSFASRSSDLDVEAQDFNSGNSSQANNNVKRNREQRRKVQPTTKIV